jgi:hypothetical protein
MSKQPIEISSDNARQGETGHGVRYVLAVSLFLAIFAIASVLAFSR